MERPAWVYPVLHGVPHPLMLRRIVQSKALDTAFTSGGWRRFTYPPELASEQPEAWCISREPAFYRIPRKTWERDDVIGPNLIPLPGPSLLRTDFGPTLLRRYDTDDQSVTEIHRYMFHFSKPPSVALRVALQALHPVCLRIGFDVMSGNLIHTRGGASEVTVTGASEELQVGRLQVLQALVDHV